MPTTSERLPDSLEKLEVQLKWAIIFRDTVRRFDCDQYPEIADIHKAANAYLAWQRSRLRKQAAHLKRSPSVCDLRPFILDASDYEEYELVGYLMVASALVVEHLTRSQRDCLPTNCRGLQGLVMKYLYYIEATDPYGFSEWYSAATDMTKIELATEYDGSDFS